MNLRSLHIYPVKSLRGLDVASAVVEPRGFRHDRRWMVIDADGLFLTQRSHPKMAQIDVAINDGALTITTEGVPTLHVLQPAPTAPTRLVEVWGDGVAAQDAGAESRAWFSEVLKLECGLVYMPDTSVRTLNPTYAPEPDLPVSFADGYPFLLLTTATLADLNARLDTPVPMNRFRPNLVVEGTEEAFDEDYWKEVRIGEVRFAVVKPCARCAIITTDQKTGAREKEPLRTLSTYRQMGGKVYFGQNLVPLEGGVLEAGTSVEVLSWR